ncbi:21730_t:CDS:2, partial [Gigaspora rosea]
NIDECASVPDSLKRARACLTYEQFKREGCDNCESFLGLCDYPDKIRECTSPDHDGSVYNDRIIALMKPRAHSFISKTKKLTRYVPGTYAVGVSGKLPDWVEEIMMDK